MPHLRFLFAAVAAVVVVRIGIPPCIASEISAESGVTEDTRNALAFPGSMSTDSFFNPDSMLLESMSSLLDLFNSRRTISRSVGSSLSLNLMKDDLKSCQVEILAGSAVPVSSLKVGLHTGGRRVSVTFDTEDTHEEHDPERGDSRSSSSVHMSSALVLPEKCIASPAALLSNLIGYLISSPVSAHHNRGMIVFPSRPLLEEFVEKGLLPANIIDVIERGDQLQLAELSPQQFCLAAGFTISQCEKLGNKKPGVASVAAAHSPDSIPIPAYDASLGLLD